MAEVTVSKSQCVSNIISTHIPFVPFDREKPGSRSNDHDVAQLQV